MMWGRYLHEGVRQSVPAEIIRALGKGCLAATAGVLLGMIVGTLHLPTASLFIIAGAAALGVVCLTGSAALKGNEIAGQHAEEKQQLAEVLSIVKALQAEFPDPPEKRFVALVERQRQRPGRGGKGI
jgi:hypothetical protein